MIGPSHEAHCTGCTFEQVQESDIRPRLQLHESQLVGVFIRRLAEGDDLGLPPIADTSPMVYQRHSAAAMCAKSILKSECSLFIFKDNHILSRPPKLEDYTGLRSV